MAMQVNLSLMQAALAPWQAAGLLPRIDAVPTPCAPMPAPKTAAAASEAALVPAAEPSAADPLPHKTVPAEARASGSDDASMTRPAGLDAPRGGAADDLRLITGLGPKLQEALHAIGIYHFDQIAAWTEAEIAWIDANIGGVRGRASRDDWAGQAATLARGEKG
jgi:NADH-quinone oxidoreductase subunit E